MLNERLGDYTLVSWIGLAIFSRMAPFTVPGTTLASIPSSFAFAEAA
jgi:hypothetical protein